MDTEDFLVDRRIASNMGSLKQQLCCSIHAAAAKENSFLRFHYPMLAPPQ